MATIDEIKQQAAAVKNATQVGENTAERVGGALAGLAEIAEQQDSKLSDLSKTENNNFNLQCALFASLLRTNIFAATIDGSYYDYATGGIGYNNKYCRTVLLPINVSSFKIKLNLFYIGIVEYDSNRKFLRVNPIADIANNVETEITLGENTKYVGIYGQKINGVTYSADSFKDSYIIINGVSDNKIDKSSIVQELGDSENKVVSQKRWTLSENSNFKLNSALFASLLRTNIFAATIDGSYYDYATGGIGYNNKYCRTVLLPINVSSFKIKLNLFYIGIVEYDSNRKFLRVNPIADIANNVETEITLGENTKYVGIYGQKINGVTYSADSFKDSYIIINGVSDNKIDKSSIVQELGDSENKVVSQKRWTLSENANFKLNSALFASLLRTNIFAAIIDNHLYDTTTGRFDFDKNQKYCCIQLFPIETSSFIIKLNLFYIGIVEYDSNRKFLRVNPIADIANNVETEITLGENTKYVGIYGQKINGVTYSADSFKDSYIIINGVSYQQFGNLLYNKKWCCCGDSFSVAGYTPEDGIPQDVYIYQDGPYKGKQKVYGTMIALRNSMNFVNLAVGGMTMCNIDGNRANSFSNNTYKNIPLDSDYITLKFGINDINFNSPIGTIDDENTSTFYGAWNTVIKWIFDNRPYSKIGIIVSSGLGDYKTGKGGKEISDATINIARKWGIPILDEVNDITVPLLHRTDRIGVSDYVKSELIKRYAVKPYTNTHPNVKAHEFESTFVEAFLRKL